MSLLVDSLMEQIKILQEENVRIRNGLIRSENTQVTMILDKVAGHFV